MATNRADTLDPALLRPGRLDRKIEFPMPDRRQKRLVFQVCSGSTCCCKRLLLKTGCLMAAQKLSSLTGTTQLGLPASARVCADWTNCDLSPFSQPRQEMTSGEQTALARSCRSGVNITALPALQQMRRLLSAVDILTWSHTQQVGGCMMRCS